MLDEHYGRGLSVARRLARLWTSRGGRPAAGPLAMRSSALMKIAVRVMGNFVTDEDADAVARVWRGAGRLSGRVDARRPWRIDGPRELERGVMNRVLWLRPGGCG